MTPDTPSPTSGFIPVEGGQLYYEADGQGQPLVLVHAGIAQLGMWDEQMPAFSRHFRVIRYDLRGFGRSTDAAAPFTHAADLRALLDHFGLERAHLLGCSKGAGVCLDFALLHPGRASALVLVCGAPAGFAGSGYEPPQWPAAVAAYKAGDWDLAAELETQIWFDGASRAPEALDPALRARVRAMDRLALPREAANSQHEQAAVPNAVERLAEVTSPVLVIAGDLDDPDLVSAAEFMARRFPIAQHVVMLGTAHLPSLEQPDKFNQLVLEFLTGLS